MMQGTVQSADKLAGSPSDIALHTVRDQGMKVHAKACQKKKKENIGNGSRDSGESKLTGLGNPLEVFATATTEQAPE
jgi:hypothetical protein